MLPATLLVGGAHGLGAAGWQESLLVLVLPGLVDAGMEWRQVQPVPVDATSVIARAVPWEQCPAFAGINPVRGKREGYVLLADRDSGMPLLAIRQWG